MTKQPHDHVKSKCQLILHLLHALYEFVLIWQHPIMIKQLILSFNQIKKTFFANFTPLEIYFFEIYSQND